MLPLRRYRPVLEGLEARCTPATYTVTTLADTVDDLDGKLSLREAIDKADTHPGTDTVAFKAGLEGTITLAGTQIGISDSLVIQGPGAAKLAISGNFSSRIFNINGGTEQLNVTIKGLEFRNGRTTGAGGAISSGENLKLINTVFTGNQSDGGGGAIVCTVGTTLTIKKSTITHNSTLLAGGGIGCPTAIISDSTIAHNTSEGAGGGINAHTVTLTRSKVEHNNSETLDGGGIFGFFLTINSSTISGNRAVNGGGLKVQSEGNVVGSTIKGNIAAGDGGGIAAAAGSGVVNVTKSVVSGNRAESFGGGITAEFANITGSTISGNDASAGGGIHGANANILTSTIAFNRAELTGGGLFLLGGISPSTIRNSTFSSNQAVAGDGGGIWSSHDDLVVSNTTIAFNRADGAGGFFAQDEAPTLESCLIAENVSVTGADEDIDSGGIGGSFALKNCLIGVEPSVSFTNNGGNLMGTVADPLDPRLAPLANNGGKTQTHALKKNSPALNAGSNSEGLTKDQRGGPFQRNFGGGVDIGAFERQ